MATEVKVPTLGESITEATLGQWLKQPGDPVKADEPIASLETDKVAVEVNAPVAGVMGAQAVKEGDTVAVGAVIASIEAEGAAAAPAAKEEPTPTPVNPPGAGENIEVKEAPAGDEGSHLTLSPAVRRIVLEHHLDPSKIKGTGKDGRLTKDDVLAAADAQKAAPAPALAIPAAAPTPAPAAPPEAPAAPAAPVAPARAGERREERVRMTRLRQTVARRLKEAQNTAAMLTTFNDVDMSAVMEARSRYKELFEKKHGIRLGFMAFFAKAAVLALRDIPAVNGSIEDEEIVYHDYVDISVAVSAPQGLVVPVLRDVQDLGFADIEKSIADFGKRARDGTLKLEEMQGGTMAACSARSCRPRSSTRRSRRCSACTGSRSVPSSATARS
jgi:2-oxoglutarate dehydrogenase E2 component (dihydrolipoamide succinyltransferase)